MKITINNFSDLSIDKNNHLLFQGKTIDRWWGKTLYYYDNTNNILTCRHFSLFGLLGHLFGYKKKYTTDQITNYLNKNLTKNPKNNNENITKKEALEAMRNLQQARDKFFYNANRSGTNMAQLIPEIKKTMNQQYLEGVLHPNDHDNEGLTLLMNACRFGDLELATKLLESGADVHAKENRYGNSAIHYAIRSKNIELVKLLIRNRADLSPEDNYHHRNGFDYLLQNYLSMVKNPEVNQEQKQEWFDLLNETLKTIPEIDKNKTLHSLMSTACEFANKEVVEILIEHGAELNPKETHTRPILTAISGGKIEFIEWLMTKGASLKFDRTKGTSPILIAIDKFAIKQEATCIQILEFLVKNGEEINGKLKDTEDLPIHLAILTGSKNLTKWLIEHGADLRAKDDEGDDALAMARRYNQLEIANLITTAQFRV